MELESNPLEKSKRKFSKRLVILLSIFGVVAVLFSIYTGLSDVAIAGFAFITTICTGYSTVGHLDYRKVLDTFKELKGDSSQSYNDCSELDSVQ